MDWQDRSMALREAFTPAAPVRNQQLFAGRQTQLVRLNDTLYELGEHATIFGERGVGKTSLASVAARIATLGRQFGVKINCSASDTASDLWRKVGEAMHREVQVDQARDHHLDDIVGLVPGAVALLTSQHVSTHDLLTALQIVAQARPVALFLDEFDRVGDTNVHTELVDLMKTVSDQAMPITIVVVGVAADVDALIDEHHSIGRGLNQVEMPRMSSAELAEIVVLGLQQAEMTIADESAVFIGQLCTGLPHYAHLMGQQAGLLAVRDEQVEVTVPHVMAALPEAVSRAQQHVRRLYFDSTHSTQRNLFKEVLLAAALAPTDERGYFAPGDLRVPMSAILDRTVEIPTFAKQLSQFADSRGPVLDRTGVSTRPRYRFIEPLLVPYVSMRGVNEKVITPALMRKLLSKKAAAR